LSEGNSRVSRLTWFTASRRFVRANSGAAAVEFALWLVAIAYPLLNVIDFGFYAFQRTQVENASQMGVAFAYNKCSPYYSTPVYTNCGSNGAAAVASGIQSTTLQNRVSTTTGGITEFLNGTSQTTGGTLTSPPSSSGNYLGVRVTYNYDPLFGRASIVSLLGTTITKTSWIRLK
jgi:Flp pilus assembly protein TadG